MAHIQNEPNGKQSANQGFLAIGDNLLVPHYCECACGTGQPFKRIDLETVIESPSIKYHRESIWDDGILAPERLGRHLFRSNFVS